MFIFKILEAFGPYRTTKPLFDSNAPTGDRLIGALNLLLVIVVTAALVMTATHYHEDLAATMRYVVNLIISGLIYVLMALLGVQVLLRGIRSSNKTCRIGCIVLSILLVLFVLAVGLQWAFL